MKGFYNGKTNIFKTYKNIEECINAYFGKETLNGNNQYQCDICQCKVDAERYTEMDVLPPILNIQLMRFVYEFTNGNYTKKKLKHAVQIPKTISARDYLLHSADSDEIYELVAVLYHKGVSVDSGHYIANVCDYNTNVWWKCDDSTVTKIDQDELLKVSSDGDTKSSNSKVSSSSGIGSKAAKGSKKRGRENEVEDKETIVNVDTVDNVDDVEIRDDFGSSASSNAYMLVYRLRCGDGERSKKRPLRVC